MWWLLTSNSFTATGFKVEQSSKQSVMLVGDMSKGKLEVGFIDIAGY
jgi:hypothetical protein